MVSIQHYPPSGYAYFAAFFSFISRCSYILNHDKKKSLYLEGMSDYHKENTKPAVWGESSALATHYWMVLSRQVTSIFAPTSFSQKLESCPPIS